MLFVSSDTPNLQLLSFKHSIGYNPIQLMQREYLKCVCICVCMSIPWEESIMNNRTEAARESVNTELFACLRVLLCVHRQNGSIFY